MPGKPLDCCHDCKKAAKSGIIAAPSRARARCEKSRERGKMALFAGGTEMDAQSTPKDDEAVIAAMRTWVEKAVIGLNLCPFARSVYVAEQVRFVVSRAPHLDGFLETLDSELDFLAAADPQTLDTTLLMAPELFADFEVFNEVAGIAEEAVEEHGLEGILQVASFHPQFRFDGVDADDVSNYTNRAPFPTLHLIREASLERALAHVPDPDAIYQRNVALLREMGMEGWKKLGIPVFVPPAG